LSTSRNKSILDNKNLIPGPRIVVTGVTGSGKTTTAARLANIFCTQHIELDSLHWLPNWVAIDREVFRQKIEHAVSGPSWVIDGNYSKARDIVWPRATTLVWLDYSLPVILWQLTRRTLTRIYTQEELWNGNRESFRGAFLSKDSLFLWALQSFPRNRANYPLAITKPENAHLQVIHFYNRGETSRWLDALENHFAKKNC
jgi:adenylate kinase family enzyme